MHYISKEVVACQSSGFEVCKFTIAVENSKFLKPEAISGAKPPAPRHPRFSFRRA